MAFIFHFSGLIPDTGKTGVSSGIVIFYLKELNKYSKNNFLNIFYTIFQGTILSTPKVQIQNKFYDDSFQKFTSPSLGTGSGDHVFGENDIPDADFSRRFSIDSFSRNSMANQNNVTMGFNRFNTISENEFEEPSVNQKFLVNGDNSHMAQRRLTQIHARNQQTKPHLKSSYALEQLPVSSEFPINSKENRDTSMRMSSVNSASIMKRKNVDDSAKSPVRNMPGKREKPNNPTAFK